MARQEMVCLRAKDDQQEERQDQSEDLDCSHRDAADLAPVQRLDQQQAH